MASQATRATYTRPELLAHPTSQQLHGPISSTSGEASGYLVRAPLMVRQTVVVLSDGKMRPLDASHQTTNRTAQSDMLRLARQQRSELNPRSRHCGPFRLPVNGFTYCPTLSSKCFSTFPHGTCLLSDSCLYLALDGVYHPLWAAFSNNPTPRSALATTCQSQIGLTPAMGQASLKRTQTIHRRLRDTPKPHRS